MDIVHLEGKKVVCSSLDLSKKINTKHRDVLRAIDKILEDYPDLMVGQDHPNQEEILWFESQNYRGQDFDACFMNKEFFSLLMMRFKTPKAREWQRKFNSAFHKMERALLKEQVNKNNIEWQKAREQSKAIRHDTTDVIKQFVDYATEQGSKSAKFYYKHDNDACYSALQLIQHKQPKLRDTLDALELAQLMIAESVAKKAIVKYMSEGEHYKAIFVLVKQDLEGLAGTMMIGHVR